MGGLIFLLIIGLVIVYTFRHKRKGKHFDSRPVQLKDASGNGKRLIVLVVDSLMESALRETIRKGKAPALQFLQENGQLLSAVVSAYPTMSVTIDSTLLTGTYPDRHRIAGLVWYDEKKKELISYGSSRKEVMMLGVRRVFYNALKKLNHDHLSRQVKTIHEILHEKGKSSASINVLVYRGSRCGEIFPPRIAVWLRQLPQKINVNVPAYFGYGSLSGDNRNTRHGHFWQSYGFNDTRSVNELVRLIRHQSLPSLSIVYLPNNDKKVHKKGRMTTKGIEKADRELQKVLDAFGSWEQALKENIWVVMGDSGQGRVGKTKDAIIDLPKLLSHYRIPSLSESITEKDQLVLALNERMAYIYVVDPALRVEEVVDVLREDGRIGFLAWRDEETIRVVGNRGKGSLSFRHGGSLKDDYNQQWEIKGDLSVLDIRQVEKKLVYGNYPDAFARLEAALRSHEGRIIVADALPGYEFVRKGSPVHRGGAAHGSLHADDSLVPVIVTGTRTQPEHRRIVDLQKWMLRLIGEEDSVPGK